MKTMMNETGKKQADSKYRVRRLKEGEKIESFDCGDADLNDFILNTAPLYLEELLAITYIMEERETGKVVAFYSLATDKVSINEFESKTEFNRFRKQRFTNAKRLKSYPAIKLCRIGVDLSARGMHLGTRILNMVKMKCRYNKTFGCRFLTVDAYIDKLPFYKKNEFNEMTDADKGDVHTRVLIYDLKKVTEVIPLPPPTTGEV